MFPNGALSSAECNNINGQSTDYLMITDNITYNMV